MTFRTTNLNCEVPPCRPFPVSGTAVRSCEENEHPISLCEWNVAGNSSPLRMSDGSPWNEKQNEIGKLSSSSTHDSAERLKRVSNDDPEVGDTTKDPPHGAAPTESRSSDIDTRCG
eukprot:1269489-Rhodomonas_salina.2